MLSETIRKTRMYSGVAQAKMAKTLFMSPSKYSRKETGKVEFTRSEALKIAKILDLNEKIILKYWMADKLYTLMKLDKDLVYESLEIVESHFDNYETCIELPTKSASFSSLEERMKHRRKKKNSVTVQNL